MTIDPQNAGGAAAGMVERVKNILLTPQAEWDRIAAEPSDLNKLYVGYALPLIGALGMKEAAAPYADLVEAASKLRPRAVATVIGGKRPQRDRPALPSRS